MRPDEHTEPPDRAGHDADRARHAAAGLEMAPAGCAATGHGSDRAVHAAAGHDPDRAGHAAARLEADVAALAALLCGRRIALLTGAGVSTPSGIPDYRSAGQPRRAPIQHQEFVRSAQTRRRYWARSLAGWPRLSAAEPNVVHRALAALEQAGALTGLVTQNVDRLHQRAGSARIVELHGALAGVLCLACGGREPRDALQARLLALNPSFAGGRAQPGDAESRPDGDAELDDAALEAFAVAACRACGGVLMPDVVFFGGTVPRERVAEAMAIVEGADALLVLGTSLAVFSGWRFVRRAAERTIPIAIVSRGPTRGDPQATIKSEGELALVVPALVEALVGRGPRRPSIGG